MSKLYKKLCRKSYLFSTLLLTLFFISTHQIKAQTINVRIQGYDYTMTNGWGGNCGNNDCGGFFNEPDYRVRYNLGINGISWGPDHSVWCNGCSCGWRSTTGYSDHTGISPASQIIVGLGGREEDSGASGGDDGDCYSNNHVYTSGAINSLGLAACTWSGLTQSDINNCSSDNVTQNYHLRWQWYWAWNGASLTNANAGGTIALSNAAHANICNGGDPAVINNSVSGLSGVTYTWQQSVNGGAWGTISGATGSNYDPPALGTVSNANTTYDYRRTATYCGGIADWGGNTTVYSNTIRINVVPDPDPPTATKSPNVASVCAGQTLTLTGVTDNGGGTGTCTIEYQVNGAGAWSATLPSFAATVGTNSISVRKNCNGSGCDISPVSIYSWTVVADPSAPTATKSPNVASVCAGQTLTLTGVSDNGGGTGTCTIEYQVNGAGAWSATLPSFAATVGTNSISVRKNCNGSGCDISPVSIYSWTVVADPSAPTATKSPNVASVCAGQTLTLTGVSDNGGGTGTCTIEYQVNGAGAWSATLPSFAATVGTNSISVRKNCNGSGCDISPVSIYSWTVVADPSAPTATKSPNVASVCAGQTLTLTGVSDNGGGTGTCTIEYQVNGAGAWSATLPSFAATVGTNSISVRKNCNGSGCDISPVSTYSWTVDPTSVAGTASSTQVICAGSAPSNMTLSGYTGSIQWQSSPDNSIWTNITGATATPLTAAQMGGTLSATTYYRAVVTSGACTAANSNVVVVYTNDADASGTIASSSSSRMCIVNDNNWHYFRNTSGEVIAAINSQGEDLGNVTMEVTIQTTPHHGTYLSEAHGDGGLGHNGDCQVLPELSVRRWYTIEPEWQNYQNGNTSKPTLIRLFLDPSDYLNYRSEIATWHSVLGNNAPNSYIFCYGTTNSIIDLAVSRNKLKDVPVTLATSNGGPGGVAQYQLSRDSLSTYRFHTNGGIGGPLPIELLSFTGYNDGAVNQLNWTTGSEVNTNQFEIQRSLDGITWETIGSVTARGAQMVSTDYNFEDANPTQGDNYYRLKIIDNDASFEYSSIIRINVKGGAAINAITQVFPNPTTGKLNVWVAATQEQAVVFNVSDALGKKVAELPRSLVGGMNKLEFNFDNLASGTYIISYVDVNGNKHYHKFVKD